MDAKEKAKLERYLKNASRFLWGLSRESQKVTYPWLRNKGKRLWGQHFDFKDGSYHDVIEQLLVNPGVERLLAGLVAPMIREQFSDRAIEFLRLSWHAGTLPAMPYLKQYKIEDPYPFLEINRQFNYVERWGDFAGVWFEEIESLLPGDAVS